MKKLLLLTIVFAFTFSGLAFGQDANVSLETKRFIKEVKKFEKSQQKPEKQLSKIKEYYPLLKIDNKYYIGGIIKVEEDFNENELTDLNVMITTKAGKIWTVKIPIEEVKEVVKLDGIEFIQTDSRIKKKLNSARAETNVDAVHTGSGLGSAYLGTGVIVGVIDYGFDLTHPMFWTLDQLDVRISRVWDQTSNTGPAPSGFGYGTEIVGTQNIINYGSTDQSGSHGTHTAGIAAGSGLGTNGYYVGVAPDAELVFVQLGQGQSYIVEAASYIFNYATSQGKPAVINMSLGTHLGPHDGTSVQDQAFEYITGTGKILVGSAGNEGGTKLHAEKSFNNDFAQTIVYFEDSGGSNVGWGAIDIWGSVGGTFEIAVIIYDDTKTVVGNTNLESSSTSPNYTVDINGVTVEIIGEASNSQNGRPHFKVGIINPYSNYYATIGVQGLSGTVHLWNNGHVNGAPLTSDFPGFGVQSGWLEGNTDFTVGEIGGTSKAVITVGAYTTKNSYTNIQGITQSIPTSLGEIASFSSHGPTLDHRIKPDVTAPGNVVVSSVNSFDANYGAGNPEVVTSIDNGSKYWYFAAMQGTSMSSPFTAGVVALMLQAKPNLQPHQVRTLLYTSSRQDNFTGNIGNGSNTWGAGKIDGYEAVWQSINYTGVTDAEFENNELFIYPNPSNGEFVLTLEDAPADAARMEVYNVNGQCIKNINISRNISNQSLSGFQEGLYFIRVIDDGEVYTSKLLLKY
ncbi:S8/S53 family peptidase [Bacteroidota bacterium]